MSVSMFACYFLCYTAFCQFMNKWMLLYIVDLLLMTVDTEECRTPMTRPTESRPRPRTNITGDSHAEFLTGRRRSWLLELQQRSYAKLFAVDDSGEHKRWLKPNTYDRRRRDRLNCRQCERTRQQSYTWPSLQFPVLLSYWGWWQVTT